MTTQRPLIDQKASRHLAATAKPDTALRGLLESGDLDSIETMLMEHLDRAAQHVEFFVGLVGALVRRKNPGQAALFLQLILEALDGAGEAEWTFCTAMLILLPHDTSLRQRLASLLRAHYHTHESFDRLASHFDLRGASDPFTTAQQLESWLAFDAGQAVYGPAYGVGTVSDTNLPIGTIKVLFQNQPQKAVSFRIGEAHKLLQPLPPGHFLRRKLECLEELSELARSDPGELLRQVFNSAGGPLSLAELKTMLSGIIADSAWNSWWGKARQDRRLTAGSGSRPQLSWADSAEKALEAIVAEFESLRGRQRLELALKHASRSPQLAALVAKHLTHDSGALSSEDPPLALEFLLAADRIAPGDIGAEAFDRFLADPGADTLILGVQDRTLRRRAVTLCIQHCRDWQQTCLRMIATESDAAILTALYEALCQAPDSIALDRMVATTLLTPERSPTLYLWLCREMLAREELRARLDVAFLQSLLTALNTDVLKTQHAALRKLFDAGGPVDEVIKVMNVDNARQLLTALDKGANLEEFRKEQLRTYVLQCHPEARTERVEVFYTTAEALETKQAELTRLVKEELPRNSDEIARAKAHGDLKENFEYHAARAKQEMLSSRAKNLHDQLACAQIVDPASVNPATVTIGTTVTFNHDGSPSQLTILGPWDSDPGRHVVSYLAPAVNALIGKKVGDEVQYDTKHMVITEIAVWR